jgi:hypothetical protein
VDIQQQITTDPAGSCAAGVKIVISEQSTFQITRTRPDGASIAVQGTASSTSTRDPAASTVSKQTTTDTTRTTTDASGSVQSVHVTGSLSVVIDRSSGTPVRTVNGTVHAAYSDGTTSSVTLTDVVRSASCPWPVSGTIVRTAADGTTHTLVFGPSCGEATLDGSAVTLAEARPCGHRGDRDGGEREPEGPGGPPSWGDGGAMPPRR